MNALKAGMLATLLGLVPAIEAHAATNIAHVVVTAPATGGGNIVCTGQACADIIRSLQGSSLVETEYTVVPELVPISREDFCRMLRATKPLSCNAAAPPLVPMFNANWQANGCGRGGIDGAIARMLMTRLYRDYSGNIDAPFPGVSFLDACNGHDACWANGGNRYACDDQFREEMVAACSGDLRCGTFASAYHAAVGTNSATSTYNAALTAYRCAEWANNLRVNGCQA